MEKQSGNRKPGAHWFLFLNLREEVEEKMWSPIKRVSGMRDFRRHPQGSKGKFQVLKQAEGSSRLSERRGFGGDRQVWKTADNKDLTLGQE